MKPCAQKGRGGRWKKPRTSLLWEGPPADLDGIRWPDGWLQRAYRRNFGRTKGRVDVYWYTPRMRYQLRSRLEVRRFMGVLQALDGNEWQAVDLYDAIKKRKLSHLRPSCVRRLDFG
jgi:hypothetical protein